MIYYPISTLMLAGIREILIITTPQDQPHFEALLGSGSDFGVSFQYEIQSQPKGLAQAFTIGEEFLSSESCMMILGDNIFHGAGLGHDLQKYSEPSGAMIFGSQVADPQRYGVAEISSEGKVLSLEEKPRVPKSSLAVPGLYFFDNTVSDRAKSVTKSARGELEITSVIDSYLRDKKIRVRALESNTAWMDCGTVDSLNKAANFVRSVEQEINFKIGCIEEIAYNNKWIKKEKLLKAIKFYGNCSYSDYLKKLL
jgi:glucose-1-phosphate thymidylyltransferase